MNGSLASSPRLDHPAPVSITTHATKRKRSESIEASSNGVLPIVMKHQSDNSHATSGVTPARPTSNGLPGKTIAKTEPVAATLEDDDEDKRTVLTLYGSAPHPRQLFSSVPKATTTRNSTTTTTTTALREVKLPPGISTTQLLSVDLVDEPAEKKRRVLTIGDVLPAPPSLALLQPPKPSKATITKGTTVDWYHPSEAEWTSDRGRQTTYYTQPLTTGQSLHYAHSQGPHRLTSSDAKRRARERTLTHGDSKTVLADEESAALEAAQTEALFRRAFSGFAPTHDDTAAIVPEEVKNRIWWDRVGEKRYERLVAPELFPDLSRLHEKNRGVSTGMAPGQEDLEEITEEDISTWVPEDLPGDLDDDMGKIRREEREVEDVMRDISELLETVSSYQRIRHLNPVTPPSTFPSAPSQTNALSTITGTPSSPSEAETMVYRTLRSQLACVIATLPPYAVAKLDGDQLAELNISTRMIVEVPDFKGVMDPEEVPGPAKAKVTGASSATTSRNGPYSTPQTQRSHHAASNVPRTAPHGTSQAGTYYPPQRSPSRGAVSRGQSRGPAQSAGAAYSIPPYNQTPRPSHAGGGAPHTTNPGQYFQSASYNYPVQYHGGPAGGAPRTSGTPPTQSAYQRPSQPAYQQLAQQRLANPGRPSIPYYPPSPYGAGSQGGAFRSGSPSKSSPHLLAPTPNHQRGGGGVGGGATYPAHATAGPHMPSRQHFQSPSDPNASHRHPTPPQQPHTPTVAPQASAYAQAGSSSAAKPVGASGYHTYLTAEQQASMMERQRAQIAAGSTPAPSLSLSRTTPDTASSLPTMKTASTLSVPHGAPSTQHPAARSPGPTPTATGIPPTG